MKLLSSLWFGGNNLAKAHRQPCIRRGRMYYKGDIERFVLSSENVGSALKAPALCAVVYLLYT